MDSKEIKIGIKKFFSEIAEEFWEKLVWALKWYLVALAVGAVLITFWMLLPSSWQGGISAIAQNIFSYVSSVAKEFSSFMGSVFTPERITKIDNWMNRAMVLTFIGVMIFALVLILCTAILSGLFAVITVKEEKKTAKLIMTLVFLSSLCITYMVVVSQPVITVTDKVTRFLAH